MSKQSKDYEVTTSNIFADLGLNEPDELLAKAKLLHEVGSLIKASNLSQQEVAKKLGITQPRFPYWFPVGCPFLALISYCTILPF